MWGRRWLWRRWGLQLSPNAFDAIDFFGGLFSFSARSPTLDGSIPLRAAQACVPLLEGNAWGLQLNLEAPLTLERRLGRVHATFGARDNEITAWHTSALLRVRSEALLPPKSAWWGLLSRGVAYSSRSVLHLFTGLFVRPAKGHRLRIASPANRRPVSLHIREIVYSDARSFTPLFVQIDMKRMPLPFVVRGEVATVGILGDQVDIRSASREAATEMMSAHTSFYDAAYFNSKREGRTTKKYRREIGLAQATDTRAALEHFSLGVESLTPTTPPQVATANGYESATDCDRLIFKTPVALTVSFDGVNVSVTPDARDMDRYATSVRDAWEPWAKKLNLSANVGALLYITKYVTPHPPGEPYFFVKPPSLMRTSKGTSVLVEGVVGDTYDVLRGVVRAESFHAAPAVFHLRSPGKLRIARGETLATLIPFPHAASSTPIQFRLENRGPLSSVSAT